LDILARLQRGERVKHFETSAHPEEQYAVRVLKAGAGGYLTKESAPQELCRAVRKVLSGGKYITPTLA
jgi:two-component system, NarL family, invasion response regulator UvrY